MTVIEEWTSYCYLWRVLIAKDAGSAISLCAFGQCCIVAATNGIQLVAVLVAGAPCWWWSWAGESSVTRWLHHIQGWVWGWEQRIFTAVCGECRSRQRMLVQVALWWAQGNVSICGCNIGQYLYSSHLTINISSSKKNSHQWELFSHLEAYIQRISCM